LSIYFQSPFTLRKIQRSGYKVRLRTSEMSLINRLCLLDKKTFLNGHNFIISTAGKYIMPTQRVIDTPLIGYEYVLIQRLLAHSLKIPLPVTGAIDFNHGITVSLQGEIYQLFDRVTWKKRIKQKIMQLPKNISQDVHEEIFSQRIHDYLEKEYFPAHVLPRDAWFVIRHAELDKFINIEIKNKMKPLSSTRISTPLSRLFWLACKHNETISPLIRQPYKLLSIFEQWAFHDGITDHLSGDTLKNALERGSPSSTSLSN
ncbi:hypothetical protein JML80_003828, partial [Escherichia coli]|nr:hypothetical protein [Escherichia coli]